MSVTIPELAPATAAAPWTQEGLQDPRPWFAEMLDRHAFAFDPESRVWHFFSHHQVGSFLRHFEDWSTAKRLEMVPPEQRLIRLLTSDGSEHTRLRAKFARPYRARRIADLEERIREYCRDLLDELVAKGEFDLTSEFAHPLTATMICEIIGIPREDQHMFQFVPGGELAQALGPVLQPGETGGLKLWMGGQAADDARTAYFADLIADRRTHPQDDMVSELAKIPEGELIGNLDVTALLLEQIGAGQNTTVHLLGNFITLLADRPQDWQRLRADDELLVTAIEETVRYSSPLQARPRIATRDLEVDGVRIPENSVGLAWLQSANLDPTVFDDPLRYDIGRTPNPHLAFGQGSHFCLGAPLARMESRVALEEMLRVVKSYERVEAGPPEWTQDCVLRGPTRVRVSVTPA